MTLAETTGIGVLAGILGGMLTTGKAAGGMIVAIILGVAGSFLGGYASRYLGMFGMGAQMGWMANVVGALILLGIYKVLMTKPRQ